MLRVKECLERGEVVGILADRVYGDEPTVGLPFLGCPARFSLSPWRLVQITGAPVVTVFGLFHGGRRYEIVFENLSTPAGNSSGAAGKAHGGAHANRAATRQTSRAGAPAHLQEYVDRLERHARRFPYNWFNFYDYWSTRNA